jgi:hypothetical protein
VPPWYWIVIVSLLALPLAIKWFFKWIVAPIVVHRRQTMAMRPEPRFAGPEVLTPEIAELTGALVGQFKAEGFEFAGNVYHANAVPGVRAVQVMLVNRSTKDIGVVIGTVGAKIRSLVFSVRSEFADGTSVATYSSRSIGVYPPNPGNDAVNFAWVMDAQTICEAHRRRLDQLGKSAVPRVAPAPGQELEYVDREWQRESERYVELKYRYVEPSAGVLRFTWKGAILTSYKLTPPIKGWRIKRRDQRSRRKWQELGMDRWSSPVAPVSFPPPLSPASPPSPQPPPVYGAYPQPSQLRYESFLGAGEIREEPNPHALTLHIGAPTVGEFLGRHWTTLIGILFWGTSLALWCFFYYFVTFKVPGRGSRAFSWTWPLLALFFLALDITKLATGLFTLRGTTTLTANYQGLTFNNVPAIRGSGHLPRPAIGSLQVVLHRAGFRKRLYRLFAILEGGARQTLLIHGDKGALEQIRSRLAQAMGIEAPGVPEMAK